MIRKRLCISVLALVLALSSAPVAAQVTFTDVTETSGMQMAWLSRWSTSQTWGDFNNDGYVDVYVTSWGQATTGEARNALFKNNGDGTFTNIASSAGVDLFFNSIDAVWGDLDNDGDLDLFVANFSEGDVIYKNLFVETGSELFSDVTSSMSFINESVGRSKAGCWGDYNNDGYLDLYVAKYWGENALYRNNSGTSFTLTDGVVNDVLDSEDANWVDYDADGDVDLYVINREQENHLYQNEDGEFTLVNSEINDTQFGRFGTWIDYDNNNRIDLFLANIGANSLYQQSLGGDFTEISSIANIRTAPNAWDTWGGTFGDYDCDGDLDLFFVGGFDETQPSSDMSFTGTEGNILFENFSNTFVDRTATAGISSGAVYNSQDVGSFASSAAFADYDNDGDPDLMITNTLQNLFYRNNNAPATYDYMKIVIDDTRAGNNRNGLGAKIRVYNTIAPTAPAAMREISSGNEPMYALFGLAKGETYNIEITFLKSGDPLQVTTKTIPNVSVPLDTVIVVQ